MTTSIARRNIVHKSSGISKQKSPKKKVGSDGRGQFFVAWTHPLRVMSTNSAKLLLKVSREKSFGNLSCLAR